MSEASRGLSELTAQIIGLSAQHGHNFKYERVGSALVQIFYAFAFGADRDRYLDPRQPAAPITGDFRLQDAQAGHGATAVGSNGVCGHIFGKGEAVYRCRDCALDDTCVLCADCFDEDAHRGHNISYSVHSSGGCCDCGDAEAWTRTFPCPRHTSNTGRSQGPAKRLPREVEQHLTDIIDLILHTVALSPELMLPPRSAIEIRRQLNYGGTEGPFAMGTGPWTCILWNDEKHNFGQVIDQVQRAIPSRTKVEAMSAAMSVDSYGRHNLLISQNADMLYSCASIIASIDLAVTVRSSQVTFCEDVCGAFIDYLLDICNASYDGDANAFGMAIARILLEPLPLLEANSLAPTTRFERLLAYDIRMWKKARQTLQLLYIRLLLLSPEVKGEMGAQYCRMYPRLVEAFLLNDREPDYSQVSFGVQVLTVPSIVRRLLQPDPSDMRQTNFLDTLVDILVAFFAEQITENNVDNRAPRRLLLPPKRSGLAIDPDSPAFKHKRYFHVLHDLSRLFESPAAKLALPTQPDRIASFVAFLDLFTEMHPTTRAVQQHVEYESDTWITAFNATIQISRLTRLCGEAFAEAPTASLARAVQGIMRNILNRALFPVGRATWCGRSVNVIDSVVALEPVSFHHPLHWLLAGLLKNLDALSPLAVQQSGYTDVAALLLDPDHPSVDRRVRLLMALDTPLRTCALLAQVRAGVWVRNGFTMRIQSLHYREYSLRETTFDQDVYLLQLWLGMLGADAFVPAMIARFDLLQWLQTGAPSSDIYSLSQCVAMLDDMLSLFITIVSETANIEQWDLERRMRREIIHFLAIGQCTMSDLTKRVAEVFMEDAAFERTLLSVANYRPPASTNDHGMYGLKPELLLEVDPYYHRYSRNQRDEAKKAVLAHLAKQPGAPAIITPLRIDQQRNLFAQQLVVALGSAGLVELLYCSLERATEQDDEENTRFSETIVDQVLHLIMLAIVNAGEVFVRQCTTLSLPFIALLARTEDDPRLDALRPKIAWCLDRIGEAAPAAVSAVRRSAQTPKPAPAVDSKKEAAQARKAAVMKQFANMQQSFLNSELAAGLEDDDLDEDEEMVADGQRKPIGTCIVCQETLDSSKEPFGTLGFVQSSKLVRSVDATPESAGVDLRNLLQAASVEQDQSTSAHIKEWTHQIGLHASSCGHMMHHRCFDTYCRSVETRHSVQIQRNHPENIDRREYICPLCKSLGNVLLPVDERGEDLEKAPETASLGDTAAWVDQWINELSRGWPSHGGRAVNRLLASNGSGDLLAWAVDEDLPTPRQRRDADALLHISPAERSMLERLAKVVHPLTMEARESVAGVYLSDELVAYTVRCMEVATRGLGTAVVDLPEQSLRLMRSLLLVLKELVDVSAGSVTGTELAAAALASRVAARDRGSTAPSSSPLTLLISAAAIAPAEFSHIATLVFYDELASILARLICWSHLAYNEADGVDAFSFEGKMGEEDEINDALGTFGRYFLAVLLEEVGPRTQLQGTFDLNLGRLLAIFTLPVLRQMAIVRRMAFNDEAETARWATVAGRTSEHARLSAYLGLPDFLAVLQSDEGMALRQRVSRLLRASLASFNDQPRADYPGVYHLQPLPRRLDLLVSGLNSQKCKRCGTTPPDPAICLLCGELVCNQTFCCMEASGEDEPMHGECNTHMWDCGGSVGVYFLVNKPSILYLYADNGSFASSPYLDEHGEANNKRNLFKYLHAPRYEEIRRHYVNHTIPTFVARKLDSLVDVGGWVTL